MQKIHKKAIMHKREKDHSINPRESYYSDRQYNLKLITLSWLTSTYGLDFKKQFIWKLNSSHKKKIETTAFLHFVILVYRKDYLNFNSTWSYSQTK